MANTSYYTEQGLQKLKDELNQLRDVERPSISRQIAEARTKVISLKMRIRCGGGTRLVGDEDRQA